MLAIQCPDCWDITCKCKQKSETEEWKEIDDRQRYIDIDHESDNKRPY